MPFSNKYCTIDTVFFSIFLCQHCMKDKHFYVDWMCEPRRLPSLWNDIGFFVITDLALIHHTIPPSVNMYQTKKKRQAAQKNPHTNFHFSLVTCVKWVQIVWSKGICNHWSVFVDRRVIAHVSQPISIVKRLQTKTVSHTTLGIVKSSACPIRACITDFIGSQYGRVSKIDNPTLSTWFKKILPSCASRTRIKIDAPLWAIKKIIRPSFICDFEKDYSSPTMRIWKSDRTSASAAQRPQVCFS